MYYLLSDTAERKELTKELVGEVIVEHILANSVDSDELMSELDRRTDDNLLFTDCSYNELMRILTKCRLKVEQLEDYVKISPIGSGDPCIMYIRNLNHFKRYIMKWSKLEAKKYEKDSEQYTKLKQLHGKAKMIDNIDVLFTQLQDFGPENFEYRLFKSFDDVLQYIYD